MPRTSLALTIAALAGLATVVHAHDATTARSNLLADLRGKGAVGQPCHATAVNSQGGSDHIYIGSYAEIFGKLHCKGPGGSINCRKDERADPPKATCWDGHEKA
jgi:hypothetical protein